MASHTRARRAKASEPPAYAPCLICGLSILASWGVCLHHTMMHDDNWARGNKVWCDYFHRGQLLPRLPEKERDAVEWYWTANEYLEP
jgi:hypothetical protein